MIKTNVKFIAAAGCAAALFVTPVLAEVVSGKVEAASANEITVKAGDGKTFKAKLSGSRTAVTIAGAKGDRANLKAGMDCTVDAPANGEEAKAVTCK